MQCVYAFRYILDMILNVTDSISQVRTLSAPLRISPLFLITEKDTYETITEDRVSWLSD